MVSVICPVYNEEKYMGACIDSVLSQDHSRNDMEILFIDGNSTDNTVKIIKEYITNYPFIKVINNPARIVPVAMNLGIKASNGDIIVRLDAHAIYPVNYISILVDKLIELNADNVGVSCKTDVLNKNPKTLAIREVLSSRFGVGNSIFRLGINKTEEVDTVPFGCYRKDVFERFGFFDARLIRNQDIELNKRIKRGGGKIYIISDIYFTYFARETFKEISKNNYANGKWNILTVFYTKNIHSLSLRHFIPMLFLLSLVLPVLPACLNYRFIYVTIISLSMYFLLVIGFSFLLAIKKRLSFVYLVVSYIVLHVSYGFGSLVGIIKIISGKNNRLV
jgi:glycosyltransferase involved in cell wall biosynthesis